MELLDNITKSICDDLHTNLKKGSKVCIAAACFSLYAFNELKNQLNSVDEFCFIFTAPAPFVEKHNMNGINDSHLLLEQTLFGTEFESKLRNKLNQKAIAKECAEWVRQKARFKNSISRKYMNGFINIKSQEDNIAYMPINGFTTVDIGCEKGNYSYNIITKIDAPEATKFLDIFDAMWNDKKNLVDITDVVIDSLSYAYRENSPEFMYFLTLYHVFNGFLEDISEDVLPNELTGFRQSKIWNMLYEFQKDAALAIINKLEKYNGCILADSVGLGKTFTALSVIKYYENRNKTVLVLCPKKLADNWKTYRDNYKNNPIASDRLNYDILFHTDLTRTQGYSNGVDLERLNWGNYDLIVIDESHNFRNGGQISKETGKENRYSQLMNKVIKAGVKTKVLMLSATPVNNRFADLKNQLELAYEGNAALFDEKLDTKKSINEIFRHVQMAFNAWSKLRPQDRTSEALLKKLDFDFFELLDSVTVARSRRQIKKYYNTEKIGKFPKRLVPISRSPGMTNLSNAINYNQIFQMLSDLILTVYTPSKHIIPRKKEKYKELSKKRGLTQEGREAGIQRLMRINLLKRLESSVYSFRLTLSRILVLITETITAIDDFEKSGQDNLVALDVSEEDFDIDDSNTDLFTVGKKIKIKLEDMFYKKWRVELQEDAKTLERLKEMVSVITPEYDLKLHTLYDLLDEKIKNPINEGNKKILIFTAFSDTAEYLYDYVSKYMIDNYGINTAVITGTIDGRTNLKGVKTSLNELLTCFSPFSKDRDILMSDIIGDIDILIATDCISEGQNLQDCDYVINYDIHWNPVRIIQRFGRIDRIGSRNKYIQLVNFWPNMTLDEYIDLKSRVETRMKVSNVVSTGDEDLLDPEDEVELEYRKQQLQRLKEEVVDLEDMSTGISITDMGLNEFRLDLMEYVKKNGDNELNFRGLYAVIPATNEFPEGVIFVLKNNNSRIKRDDQNRIYPYYMVYIKNDGTVFCDYIHTRDLLNIIRLLCKDNKEPNLELCKQFNEETENGNNMQSISILLKETIQSMISIKKETSINSLFKPGGTSLLDDSFSGVDDFELICFMPVRKTK